jgi:hypothetical protein
MSRIPGQAPIKDGLTPKEAFQRLEQLRALVRPLEHAARDLINSYDAELHRCYGYDVARPLPDGADSIAALDAARASWRRAADELVSAIAEAGI